MSESGRTMELSSDRVIDLEAILTAIAHAPYVAGRDVERWARNGLRVLADAQQSAECCTHTEVGPHGMCLLCGMVRLTVGAEQDPHAGCEPVYGCAAPVADFDPDCWGTADTSRESPAEDHTATQGNADFDPGRYGAAECSVDGCTWCTSAPSGLCTEHRQSAEEQAHG